MKSLFTTFLLVLAVATALTGQAQTIRRVNNTGITGTSIYTTLQAAHDAASNGDIIYLEPSGISYGSLNSTKRLTIIGNGYFLAQNPGLQLTAAESLVGTVQFGVGSTGSRITGCDISTMGITASDVVVERNKLTTTYIGYNITTGATVSVSNVLVRQNYFESGGISFYPGSSTTVSNISISSNILAFASINTASGQYSNMNNIIIANNVIGDLTGNNGYTIDVDNAVIKNNILTYTSATATFNKRNNVTSYNISGGPQFGTANNNQQNVSPSAIFVGGTASTDGAFQLKAGSPATGTGESGGNIGAYGGAVPYRVAGIPNVPAIYEFNQSVSGNTLNATISTRSNN
ncbi:hypothetical protein [Hymenobacter sp. IS2118]|uniref:hypothetical protein n=1 Tax=Hymenobacter sp. IS2118 TaxID=1505605 RepID=UPI000556492C|nr:hypothetical protein [Hymenobacter sp. IS2118]